MRNKKAQVTIYIIIGIVLVAALGLFLFIRTTMQEEDIRVTTQDLISDVPVEFRGVYSYTETCLLDIAVEGIKTIGEHGGYADPVAAGKTIGASPTEGNAFPLVAESDLIIPFWYYLESDNTCSKTCKFKTGYPNLRKTEGSPSIEEELERYIDSNLNKCLQDFEPLLEQGYTIEDIQSYKSTVQITGEDIVVTLDYRLSARTDKSKHDFERFITIVPLDMERIYKLARQLTDQEMQFNYLEKHMANLIVGFSGLEKDLPPIADVTVQFGSESTWQKPQVKKALMQIMESNIPLFQVQNTRNYETRLTSSETKNALYNRGTNIPNELDTSDMNVYFTYIQPESGWEPYFDLNCNGNTCGPMSVSSNLVAPIGIQRYKFFYDVSNPVLVEINSPDELTNFMPEGFRFKFFLESNLRDNAPLKEDYERLTQLDLGTTMFCDVDKRNSGDITLEVKDQQDKPVESASVVYLCGEDTCVIGDTDSTGTLTARFPVCIGGVVSVLHDDYSQYSAPLSTELNKPASLKATLAAMQEKKIAVYKKMLHRSGDSFVLENTLTPLFLNEEAIVTMERIQGIQDAPYSAFATVTGQEPTTTSTLTPGTYTVQINLLLNEEITVPDVVRDGVEIKGTTMEGAPSGKLNLNITLTENDLASDKVTFVVIGVDPREFGSMLDFDAYKLWDEYSQTYEDELQPIFE